MKKLRNFYFFILNITIIFNYYSCEIVSHDIPEVDAIVFSSNTYETSEGTITDFTAFIGPKDFKILMADIKIESSDRDILTVSILKYVNGVITFSTTSKKAGRVVITITATGKSATAIIKVKPIPLPPTITLKSINLNTRSLFLEINESFKLSTNVRPKNATDTSVNWVSVGTGIYVDTKGVVTAQRTGNYLVLAISNSDNKIVDTCKVYVVIKINKITINKKNILLKKDELIQLSASISPLNATYKNIAWKSDNLSVSVNTDGVISGDDYGIATITASSLYDNNIFDKTLVTVASLKLSNNSLSLAKGTTQKLTVTIIPDLITNKNVIWTSDNQNVATIDQSTGVITPKSNGNTNIIATSVYHSGLFDTCKLTISVPVNKIVINKQTLTLIVGNSEILTANVLPTDANDLSYSWSSDNEKLATVDPSTGEVKTLKSGIVNIIATSNFGDKSIKDTCVLNIKDGKFGINLSHYSLSINKDQKFTITANITIPNETNKKVIWTSDAVSIATVDASTGEITGISEGTVNIIATSEANSIVKDTCIVTVNIGVNKIILDKTNIKLDLNSVENIMVTIEPADATEKGYTWSSSNPNIASVDINGVVSSNTKIGNTILKATSNSDNTKFATCNVDVFIFVKTITLNNHSLSLENGNKAVLTYTISPLNPTNANVIWSSSNTSIATVTNGNISTGKSDGTAKIYIESVSNPEIKDSCIVNVITSIKSISLNQDTIRIIKGGSETLIATILPANALDKTVNWTTSNSNVSVNDGVVTGAEIGDGYVYATTNNGLKDSCFVIVTLKVTGITLSQSILVLNKNQKFTLTAELVPNTVSNKLISWSSSDITIATVTSSGEITAISKGNVNITATYINDNTIYSVCNVTIIIPVLSVTLDQDSIRLKKNETRVLLATVLPTDASDKTIKWSSSNPNILVINGSVSSNVLGVGYVYATASNGIKDSCKVSIIEFPNLITFNFEALKNQGMPNDVNLVKYGTLAFGGDFKYIGKVNLIPTFTLNPNNTVKVNNIVQTSGVTVQDFSSPVYYNVYASDNSFFDTYRISINFINDSLEFNVSNELVCKSIYKSNINTAILADSMNGKSVTYIGASAFESSTSVLKSLKFPNTITGLGKSAFNGCSKLTGNLVIPNSITTIEPRTFNNCSGLTGTLTLPNSLVKIDSFAFNSCGFISNLNIPNSVTYIGPNAFYSCKGLFGNLNIPNSVTFIGSSAFAELTGFVGTLTIPNSVVTIGASAFQNSKYFSGSLVIPNSVTSIGPAAFFGCASFNLGLTISNSITKIENSVFQDCGGFTGTLIIPNSVKKIGNNAFENCVNFTGDLNIPNSVDSICEAAFRTCLGFSGKLTIPNSVTFIGNRAFNITFFTGDLYLPSSIKTIEFSAFSACTGFTSITYSSKTVLGINVFSGVLVTPTTY